MKARKKPCAHWRVKDGKKIYVKGTGTPSQNAAKKAALKKPKQLAKKFYQAEDDLDNQVEQGIISPHEAAMMRKGTYYQEKAKLQKR